MLIKIIEFSITYPIAVLAFTLAMLLLFVVLKHENR